MLGLVGHCRIALGLMLYGAQPRVVWRRHSSAAATCMQPGTATGSALKHLPILPWSTSEGDKGRKGILALPEMPAKLQSTVAGLTLGSSQTVQKRTRTCTSLLLTVSTSMARALCSLDPQQVLTHQNTRSDIATDMKQTVSSHAKEGSELAWP